MVQSRGSANSLIVEYEPTGWTKRVGWVGRIQELLPEGAAEVVLLMHEVIRPFSLSPRLLAGWAADLLALRLLLARARRAVVTTENRRALVAGLCRTWGLSCPISVAGVPSNVHSHDPDPRDVGRGGEAVAVFARSGGGVLAQALAASLREVLRRRPSVRVVLLGERGPRGGDAVLDALHAAGIASAVEVTGYLPPAAVAARLAAVRVGLALHEMGISGRRGTVSAMLASGLPVVAARGLETDPWFLAGEGVIIAGDAARPDPERVAEALIEVIDDPPGVHQRRRAAALSGYLAHSSWQALRRAMGESCG